MLNYGDVICQPAPNLEKSMMIREGLTFDDVLLVPKYSTITSRSEIDLSVEWRDFKFKHPIIPANMKSVISEEMIIEIISSGGLAILHRFMDIEEQYTIAKQTIDKWGHNNFAVSVGIKNEDLEHIVYFHQLGVRIVCIDIAHGDSNHCVEMIKSIKNLFPDITVIAGNVATGEGAKRLWKAGADIVKAGVGPGSLCTTRIETGNGVPQLSCIIEIAEAQKQMNELEIRAYSYDSRRTFPFISDGGIKNAGDIVKALCFADMVMVGNLFAGCKESPGITHTINGICHKEYAGSSTHKANHVEGVVAWVPCKGTYKEVSIPLLEGVQSGCSYQGCVNLARLKDNPVFIKITNAGLRESHPHDVVVK